MKAGIRFKLIISLIGVILLSAALASISGIRINHNFNLANTIVFRNIFILVSLFILGSLLLVRLISRDILVPLKELNHAAEKIMKGNLDFEIHYNRNDEMGRFISVFKMMRDKLKESLAKQEAYERSRKKLIANISHDLRTPLTSIRGYVEGLQDGMVHDKEKYDRYLAVIKDKTNKLDKRIEDLFQFSQLELGEQVTDYKVIDSQELLEAILSPIEMEFNDFPTNLLIYRPFPSLPVHIDYHQMVQVFDNLIDNAKKYAGTYSEITIKAKKERETIRISISDNGIGIQREDMPNLFERFYQGEKSRSREFGGIGLGLAICKQIVEEHGGHIGAHSRLGKGTEFYFTLPVGPSNMEEEEKE
jgi:signal transduction histidine kinase